MRRTEQERGGEGVRSSGRTEAAATTAGASADWTNGSGAENTWMPVGTPG